MKRRKIVTEHKVRKLESLDPRVPDSLVREYPERYLKYTEKELSFLYYYLQNGFNGVQAVLDSKYEITDNQLAGNKAHELLKQENIRLVVEKKKRQIQFVTGTDFFRILEEELSLALSDIKNFKNDKGEFMPLHELPSHLSRAVKQVKEIRDKKTGDFIRTEYKLHDKGKALERLEKILGFTKEKQDIDLTVRRGLDGEQQGGSETQSKTEKLIEVLGNMITESPQEEDLREPEEEEKDDKPYTIESANTEAPDSD